MVYEFDGEKYQKASSHQKEWGAKLISELTFQGHERILDLGCGDGAITEQLAAQVPGGSVLGIDASQNMIDTATRCYQRENLRFRLLDINALDFADEFDIIISNATLHWIHDHNSLISNVYRSLKTNGIARFNFAADGNCSHFYKVVKRAMKLDEFAADFEQFKWPWYMPGLEEYAELVEAFPSKEKKVWGENADRYFTDTDAMVKWVDQPSLVPFLKHIKDAGEKKHFRNRVVAEMIKETKQEDGTFFETFRRINVFLEKGSF